ncbi:MAG: hypothetical protein E6177_12900 [Clostridium sp.]|nr:hypothetical protein [Clostridium sp.]
MILKAPSNSLLFYITGFRPVRLLITRRKPLLVDIPYGKDVVQ